MKKAKSARKIFAKQLVELEKKTKSTKYTERAIMAAGVMGVALVITACVAFPPNLAALAVGVAIGSTLAAGKVSTLVTDEVDKSIQKAEKTLARNQKKYETNEFR